MSGRVRYRMDPAASRFTARASAPRMLSAFGHNPAFAIRKFSGEAELDGGGTGSLDLRIESDSLDLVDDVSQRDRREILRTMNEQLLETSRVPVLRTAARRPRFPRAPPAPAVSTLP